jgi:hypothetical protein
MIVISQKTRKIQGIIRQALCAFLNIALPGAYKQTPADWIEAVGFELPEFLSMNIRTKHGQNSIRLQPISSLQGNPSSNPSATLL